MSRPWGWPARVAVFEEVNLDVELGGAGVELGGARGEARHGRRASSSVGVGQGEHDHLEQRVAGGGRGRG